MPKKFVIACCLLGFSLKKTVMTCKKFMLIIKNLQTRHYKERSNLVDILVRYALCTIPATRLLHSYLVRNDKREKSSVIHPLTCQNLRYILLYPLLAGFGLFGG